jgi:hypothetical protein
MGALGKKKTEKQGEGIFSGAQCEWGRRVVKGGWGEIFKGFPASAEIPQRCFAVECD